MSSTALQTQNCPNQSPGKTRTTAWRRPAYDVSENAEDFNIRVNLPGVSREGVDISIEDEVLAITGTRSKTVNESWRPLRRELPDGDFRLDLRLNVPVKEDKIKAKVADGILELILPKVDEVKPRKIKVS